MMLVPRVGIRGMPPDGERVSCDFFEWDALQWAALRPAEMRAVRRRLSRVQGITLTFGHYFFKGVDRVDRRERAVLAAELHQRAGAEGGTLIVPASLDAASERLSEIWVEFRREYSERDLCLPLVDAPFELSDSGGLERVGDPAWVPVTRECRKPEWRVHGYHPERWVRRYSQDALDRLALAAIRHRPRRVTFVHSQRVEQVGEFIRLLTMRGSQGYGK